MGYERYPRGRSHDDWNRDTRFNRDADDAAARDYGAGGNTGYGRDDYGERGYYSRNRSQDYGRVGDQYGRQYDTNYSNSSDTSYADYNSIDYGSGYGGNREFGRDRDYGGRNFGGGAGSGGYRGNLGYARDQQDYDRQNRGFFDRAGDEVRSWFGDDEAERRRQMDAQNARDRDYQTWRSGQIDALDRDYDEYRRENQQKFSNEFGSWRTDRQGQRTSLGRVTEHMDVVGSDGAHIGTVDKVRGDRIILTKSDADAGGRHHSIPSRWIQNVDDNVTVRKTADEAKAHWRDEERSAFFVDNAGRDEDAQGHILNRSFSGTY